jgi:biotin carboxyl carrier protein
MIGLAVLAIALLTATLSHGVPPFDRVFRSGSGVRVSGRRLLVSHGRDAAMTTRTCGSIERNQDGNRAVPKVRVKMAEDVRAEIVASVLEVVVREGDKIGEGDTLVLLESMKMEIPVLAEVAGTITEVSVSVGDVIQAGDLIAVIDQP